MHHNSLRIIEQFSVELFNIFLLFVFYIINWLLNVEANSVTPTLLLFDNLPHSVALTSDCLFLSPAVKLLSVSSQISRLID